MKSIKVSDLKPGMKFTAPVYLDGENLLVPEKIEVKEKDIKRLVRWNITEVQTEGELIDRNDISSDLDIKVTIEDHKILELYEKSINDLDNIFTIVRNNEPVSSEDIDSIVTVMLSLVNSKPEELRLLTITPHKTKNILAQSSLNTMILAMLIGIQMKMISHKLLHLSVAALLHDIGMTKIPEPLLSKKGELTQQELMTIKSHTILSYKLITKTFKYPEEVGRIAMFHHERWDGKGYPKGLKGNEIPVASRILSIADAFEAMVRERPYRDSMIGYKAIKEILNDNSRRFDSVIIKLFIKSMGLYPVGSIVILNNGSIGRVKSIHQESPLRPLVELIMTPEGRVIKESNRKEIDLFTDKKVFIVRAINLNELKNKAVKR